MTIQILANPQNLLFQERMYLTKAPDTLHHSHASKPNHNMTRISLGIMTIDRLTKIVLPGLVGLAIAKSLGTSDYGKLSWAIGVSTLLSPVTSLGANQLIQVLAKRFKNSRIANTILINGVCLQIIGSVIAAPIYGVIIFIVNSNEMRLMLAFLWLSSLLQSGDVGEFWLLGQNKIKTATYASILSSLSNTFLKLIGVFNKANTLYYPIAAALGSLFRSIILYCYIKHSIGAGNPIKPPKRTKFSAYLFHRATKFSIGSATTIIYLQSDIVILGILDSKDSVGAYSIICLLLTAFTSLGSILPTYYYPKINIYNKHELQNYFRKTALVSISLIFIYAGASLFILDLLSSDYSLAINAALIVSPLIYFSSMGSALGYTQSEERLEKYSLMNTTTGAFTNIVLNFILIPFLGINGAAIAFILASFTSGYVAPIFNKTSKSKCYKYFLNPF